MTHKQTEPHPPMIEPTCTCTPAETCTCTYRAIATPTSMTYID